MNEKSSSCICGRLLACEAPGRTGEKREFQCACGRLYDFEFREAGWVQGSSAITPEARQPLTGFSRDLKASEDCRRYYFFHSIAGRRLPVHILFSPSAEQAEVKTGDMKALRIAPVLSVVEARRRWIERFDSLPARGSARPRHASRRGIFPAL
jgi:hypothetical protein